MGWIGWVHNPLLPQKQKGVENFDTFFVLLPIPYFWI